MPGGGGGEGCTGDAVGVGVGLGVVAGGLIKKIQKTKFKFRKFQIFNEYVGAPQFSRATVLGRDEVSQSTGVT